MKSHYVPFRQKFSYEQRKNEATDITRKYPDRIPVIVEIGDNQKITIDKHKYLVPMDLSVGQFVYVIRKRIKLEPEKALFMFINNLLPPTSAQLSQIYYENKDIDGFLYTTIMLENTFGFV